MDPVAPRELHFSHNSTQFRAVLVDDSHLVAFAADNPCSICGYQLNNIAFYAIEPDTFYVHVVCALQFPLPPPLPGTTTSSSSSSRSISQQANPYAPQTYVNPHHMNSYANNYNFYGPPVPNYPQAGSSVSNYPQPWPSVPSYPHYVPPVPNYPQTGPSVPNYPQAGSSVSNYPQPWPSVPSYPHYVPPVPNYPQAGPSVPNYLQPGSSISYYPQPWPSVPNYLQPWPSVPNTLQYVQPVPNTLQSAPYSHVYPANSSTGNYEGSAGRIGGVLGQVATTVMGSFLQALFDNMFDEVSF